MGRKKKAEEKKDTGRPTVMTPETLQKLELGFMHGMTDVEACLYANISKSTLYNYCNENPAFMERKEELKKQPSVKAKLNVVNAIEMGDVDLSKWYLERRNKDEFSQKQQIEAEVNSEVNITIELVDE